MLPQHCKKLQSAKLFENIKNERTRTSCASGFMVPRDPVLIKSPPPISNLLLKNEFSTKWRQQVEATWWFLWVHAGAKATSRCRWDSKPPPEDAVEHKLLTISPDDYFSFESEPPTFSLQWPTHLSSSPADQAVETIYSAITKIFNDALILSPYLAHNPHPLAVAQRAYAALSARAWHKAANFAASDAFCWAQTAAHHAT